MSEGEPGEVTRLLLCWSQGDKQALDRLFPVIYRELRRLAAAYMKRERRDHTLQTTGLVHEAYLNLVDQNRVDCRSRAEFFAVAANVMRHLLVNHAKRRHAAKRGGGENGALENAAGSVKEPELDLLELDTALDKLGRLDARKCRIVEMRFFGGLTEEEIADVTGVSPATVKRDWRVARAVLRHQLQGGGLN
jgi:RNA polymerase sigma factor (TIGR02999 family)